MDKALFVVVGGIIGIVAMSGGRLAFGLIAGVVLGLLLAELLSLGRRVRRLEQPERQFDADEPRRAAIAREIPVVTPEPDGLAETQPDSQTAKPAAVTGPAQEQQPEAPGGESTSSGPVAEADTGAIPPLRKDTPVQQSPPWAARAWDWLTTGNVPVKVGVIVSFFGIAFLLKYAVDRNLLIVPIWLRLVFAAAFGAVLLLVGWRLRHRMRTYALSLQGGGIGIIYLTVFAAYRLYGLLPPVAAFALLAMLTVPMVWLAVTQNARALAFLAVTGGFLAPLLASTGKGSHVALFSYYLLLNLGIVAIARYRAWRELNLAGFLFTFVIGTLWGSRYYRPAYFTSTEPFLVAHFVLYQVAAILFALRQPPRLRGIVDGTLVFGAPVIAFALQAAMLRHSEYGLAISAVVLAVFYAAVAWWLGSRGEPLRTLRDSYYALAVAFATVAIPLAFDARWTAATWAMEGAALVWLGARQRGWLSSVAGVALIGAAGVAFVGDGWHSGAGRPVLNGNVLGGLLLSLAGFFAARQLGRERAAAWRVIGLFFLAWGVVFWLVTGMAEIDERVRFRWEYPFIVAFIALSGALLAFFAQRLRWPAAATATRVMLPILIVTLLARGFGGDHPLERHATVPWLLAAAAHLYVLWGLPANTLATRAWHVMGVMLAAWLLAWELSWWVAVETWRNTAVSLLLTGIATGSWLAGRVVRWPFRAESLAYLAAAGLLLLVAFVHQLAFNIDSAGNPLPLPYLPLLNPYDIAAAVFLVAAAAWALNTDRFGGVDSRRYLLIAVGAAAFLLTTFMIVRAVHHYAGVPWREQTLIDSVEVQAALSIYWGALGFAGMVLGANRRMRWLWLTGAGLMALVVLKLFVVDLGNSGTVARIVSFIGVGGLLLVVGYFAPAPPRAAGERPAVS